MQWGLRIGTGNAAALCLMTLLCCTGSAKLTWLTLCPRLGFIVMPTLGNHLRPQNSMHLSMSMHAYVHAYCAC